MPAFGRGRTGANNRYEVQLTHSSGVDTMNRREFTCAWAGLVGGIFINGCAVKWADESASSAAAKPAAEDAQNSSRFSQRTTTGGPSDIKTLSQLLQRAGYPLNSGQIEFLQNLKEGPEFTKSFRECLDEGQLNAVKTNSRSRGRRRR